MNKTLFAILSLLSLITARASVFQYSVTLDGPSESPVNASPGVGSGTVSYDDANHSLQLQVTFSGLLGTTTASHIHAPTVLPFTSTAGVATTTPTFANFPLGVTAGSYANTLDLTSASSYNASFISAHGGTPAGAELALASAMAGGQAYWNIHTTSFPGGEIRGFLVPIPEPGTITLLALGALGIGMGAWKSRSRKA